MSTKISVYLLVLGFLAQTLAASTATLTPESSYFLPGGGTTTFTANLAGYPGTTTAVGWAVTLPAGWSYVSGDNEPGVKPSAGTTGTLEWAYVTIPGSASFSFTVSYPAGISTARDVTSLVIVRSDGPVETVTLATVTLSPGTIPVITSASSAGAGFDQIFNYAITATSSVAIASYGASGLPAGLRVDAGTGLISGAPTQLGDFSVTLTATNGAGSGTSTVTISVGPATAALMDRTFFGGANRNSSSTGTERVAQAIVKVGDVAATLPANRRAGFLLIVAPAVGINELVSFTLRDDNTFTTTATQHTGSTVRAVTCNGQLRGGTLSGSFAEAGMSFALQIDGATGSADAQGLYISPALHAGAGTTYTIIGGGTSVLVLVVTPTLTVGGATTLQNNGTFTLAADATNLSGSVNTLADTVSITLATNGTGGTVPLDFGGLKNTTSRTDRLINLSSRVHVRSGERILISGFVIGGTSPKPVLVRAVGPGLIPLGVRGELANPRIQILRSGVVVAENDDWGANANPAALVATMARLGAFPLAPGSTDAALMATLSPGVYCALVTGGEGIAMAEVYDASENPAGEYQRLVNISARGEVSVGDNILIGGFVVTGNASKRILLRGVGPTLASQGVANPLSDPILRVFQRSTQIAENDDWSTDSAAATERAAAATKTGAFALPTGSRDAALILTLQPGVYTVHVNAGAGAAPGIALVEIYEIPE